MYVNSITLSGRHPHSDNLPATEMFLDITLIRSNSPSLKPLCRKHKRLFAWRAYEHIINVQIII